MRIHQLRNLPPLTLKLTQSLSSQQLLSQLAAMSSFHPGVVTDIDGVLLRGHTPINGVMQALKRLQEQNIPFCCLTNGGGKLESQRAAELNNIFGEDIFDGERLIMSHTPMKPKIVELSKKGLILLSGSLNVAKVVQDLGVRNYITADELHFLVNQDDNDYSFNNPAIQNYLPLELEELLIELTNRLQEAHLPLKYSFWAEKISGIFAINDVSPYETTLEVIHNILTQRSNHNQPLPPYFAAQNDAVWAGGYHRPRLAFGPFNYLLEDHCQRYHFSLQKTYFGKPEPMAFQYAQKIMRNKFDTNIHFMIGDNPRADIRGANSVKWPSFLTQTGVHKGSENDLHDPATFVVDDFSEAIEKIIKIKRER